MSQACATPCAQVPTLEMKFALKSIRKLRCLNDLIELTRVSLVCSWYAQLDSHHYRRNRYLVCDSCRRDRRSRRRESNLDVPGGNRFWIYGNPIHEATRKARRELTFDLLSDTAQNLCNARSFSIAWSTALSKAISKAI